MAGKLNDLLRRIVSLPRALWRRIDSWLAFRRSYAVSLGRARTARISRVLVVCYGNIYRSPFAAKVLSAAFKQRGVPIEVRSAGFFERIGRATPEDFLEISYSYGIDLRSHRSSLINADAVHAADLVVVMDRLNWDRLVRFGADARSKAVWLGAFLHHGPKEISDPYGCHEDEMREIARQLHEATRRLGDTLESAVADRVH